MKARALGMVAVFLVACSQSHPTAAVSPTSPSPVSSPTAIGDLPVTPVDFSCRLPVVTVDPNNPTLTEQGGFIAFPGGRLQNGRDGTMLQRGYPYDDFATVASPVLSGTGGGFYDQAAKRWVPASPAATLPDGSAYAYVTIDSTLRVVDVASGNVRTFSLKPLDIPAVAEFTPRGVYLYEASGIGGPGEGLWLLNLTTGSVTQVAVVHRVWAIRDGKAWVARLDPRDKTVWQGTEIAPADTLAQVDLATGVETQWFYRAGAYPWMIGLVSGRPLISVGGSDHFEIRLLDKPGSEGTLIYSGVLPFDGYFQNYQGDARGIWLGSPRGIYLYRPGRGFQKVFAFNAGWGSGGGISPAGFCV